MARKPEAYETLERVEANAGVSFVEVKAALDRNDERAAVSAMLRWVLNEEMTYHQRCVAVEFAGCFAARLVDPDHRLAMAAHYAAQLANKK